MREVPGRAAARGLFKEERPSAAWVNMCCRSIVPAAYLCAAVMLAIPDVVRAGLFIDSQSVKVSSDLRQATFTIAFDHPPDFALRDSLGRPLESFQYEIAPDCTDIDQCPFTAIRAVVRGDEIGSGQQVPIRDGVENGSDPSPASGGWGNVRGSVPFRLQGSTLTFSTPLSLLQDPDGDFAYRVFTTSSGQTESLVTGESIPLPAALWTGGSLLLALGLLSGRSVLFRGR